MNKSIKITLNTLLFFGLTACTVIEKNYSYTTHIQATQANPHDDIDNAWFLKRHEKKLQKNKNNEEKKINLVFIGDSITHYWETKGKEIWNRHFSAFNALNLGFTSDRTEHVLWRLQNGEIDGLNPKLIVLMIGTNNTGHRNEKSEDTAYGIFALTQEIRQRLPKAKILLLGIFPREATVDDPLRKLNEGVNNIIKNYADNKGIYYLNINKAFLDVDGNLSKEVMPDLLHPNAIGYQIWADSMLPTIKELMAM